MPGSKNVFGNSLSPARVNRLNRLYHFPLWHIGIGRQPIMQFVEICD
jgi:hypothetical protein